MQRLPLHRARYPRTRRLAGWLIVGAVGVAAPLSIFAGGASATSTATCDAAAHTVTLVDDATARIVRAGNNVTVPGCAGSGAVLGAVGNLTNVTVRGGGANPTLVIDLSGGRFPSSVRFDVNLGSSGVNSGGKGTLSIVGSSGPDQIIAGRRGIALDGDDVVNLGDACDPDCLDVPGVQEITLDSSRAAGAVNANLFQRSASGAKLVSNFARLIGSPFSDDLVGDHDNYIA